MIPEDPYYIRAHVREFELIAAGYRSASDEARSRWPHLADVAYGATAAERLDLFFPARSTSAMPIHLFVHGGYWRANIKEDYAFVANTACKSGAIAAIVEYPLMPAARIATLVARVRRAASWLRANATRFGGDPAALSASGHSAGAHLASYLAARGPDEPETALAPLRSLLLVSGIYDLSPITNSFLQSELSLTADEVAKWSPLSAIPVGEVEVTVAVGERETLPFHQQAEALAHRLSKPGNSVRAVTPRLCDHMTIMRDLGDPDTETGKLLEDCIAHSRSGS